MPGKSSSRTTTRSKTAKAASKKISRKTGKRPNKVKAVPKGYHTVTPYLCIKNAAAAIDFYKKAFGATEKLRLSAPDGKVGHAEIVIGNSHLMIADEFPEMDVLGPQTLGGSAVTIHLYVEDVDTLARRAVAAGAKELRPVEDQFYGDRGGKFADPFGHVWWLSTHVEDVSETEIRRRAKELYGHS